MKELVVISGKGGTGKTSITASFAALAKNAVIADCDVDAADLHLIANPEKGSRNDFYSGRVAGIDSVRCTGCGQCVEDCRYGAVFPAEDGKFRVDPAHCEGCGVCVRFCPVGAIEFPERLCGTWSVSDTRFGTMVHAELGAAAENSGKLVALVRKKAAEVAEEKGADCVIVDGPPGIGCPVIAGITGVDMVLVVTEPSVSGLHDMVRILDLAAHFSIDARVCINKFDINPGKTEEIEALCAERGIPVLQKIPYSGEFTAAQLAGLSIAEMEDSPVQKSVIELWEKTCQSMQ